MLFLLMAQLCSADVAPLPEGTAPAEEACDAVTRASDQVECARCTVYRESRRQCEQLEVQGYSTVCKVPGTKVSAEVLCRPVRAASGSGEASTQGASDDSGASSWGCMHLAPAASLPFLLLAVVPLRRRRSGGRDHAA